MRLRISLIRCGSSILTLSLVPVVGPLAAPASQSGAREVVQAITLFALRAVGVADARARGLVVQARMP